MALKFRRTLSMEDLVNASDEEMDDLLSNSLREDTNNSHLINQSQRNTNGHTTPSQYHHNQPVSSEAIRNGMRVGTILAPGIDSPENDDFFLHGPQAPILNLNNADLTPDYDQNHRQSLPNNSSEGTTNLPRSKSVRFQEPEANSAVDPLKKVRNQVTEVTEKMRDNVSRLLDREANLDSLADLSDQLQYSSDIYRQSSEHLRRKMWWRQQRTRLVLGAVFIIGIFLLLIPIITKLLQ